MDKSGYVATIGIECHVQLKTKTKLFAAVEIANGEAEPNTHISQICLALPGALPVLNKHAVELGIKAAYTLNTKPQKFSKFDRKHYFYPDLPKGYQITQFEQPIILGGYVETKVNGELKKFNITRAHLEEDAGKTIHPAGAEYSLVDLNRAGTPLLEIVSEPEMHSPQEAKAYAHELYLLMRYGEITDGDLYHGNMRFDVNVSVSKDANVLGTRTETKNLNSFRSVEKAAEFEIKRQIELLEKGESVTQETRGWNDTKQKTFSQRSKENAYDYRYFPDADIPPVILKDEVVNSIPKDLPVMPNQLRQMLEKLNLDDSAVETLVEEIISGKFILDIMGSSSDDISKRVANWLTSDIQGLVSENKITWESAKLDQESFVELANSTINAELSSTNAKVVLSEMVISGGKPSEIAKRLNLTQVSDENELKEIVRQVLKDNPAAAADLKAGTDKAIGFLVGMVMKASHGQANPQVSQKLIRELISEI